MSREQCRHAANLQECAPRPHANTRDQRCRCSREWTRGFLALACPALENLSHTTRRGRAGNEGAGPAFAALRAQCSVATLLRSSGQGVLSTATCESSMPMADAMRLYDCAVSSQYSTAPLPAPASSTTAGVSSCAMAARAQHEPAGCGGWDVGSHGTEGCITGNSLPCGPASAISTSCSKDACPPMLQCLSPYIPLP